MVSLSSNTITSRFADKDVIERFVSILSNPGEVRELRIIQGKKIVSGYFDNIDKLAQAAAAYSGKAAIYLTLNPT